MREGSTLTSLPFSFLCLALSFGIKVVGIVLKIYGNKDQFQQSQQGTGSAENQNRSRQEQMNPNTEISQKDRRNISNEIGNVPVASPKDLGALSGRDDASGGSGDRMEEGSTGEETER